MVQGPGEEWSKLGGGGGRWTQLWPRTLAPRSSWRAIDPESDQFFPHQRPHPPPVLSQSVAREMGARKTSQSPPTFSAALQASRLSGQRFQVTVLRKWSWFGVSRFGPQRNQTVFTDSLCQLPFLAGACRAVALAYLKLAVEKRTKMD